MTVTRSETAIMARATITMMSITPAGLLLVRGEPQAVMDTVESADLIDTFRDHSLLTVELVIAASLAVFEREQKRVFYLWLATRQPVDLYYSKYGP